MLRIIVGQDPYPDTSKQLSINNYPCDPVAFYQPNWDVNEKSFNRVVRLIHSMGEPHSITPEKDVINLAKEGLFLFNAYEGHVKIGNQTVLYGPKNSLIMSFVNRCCTKLKVSPNDVHFLLCGDHAYDLMYSEIVSSGYNSYRAPHPSSRNSLKTAEIFWDRQVNKPGQHYIDNATAIKYFQVD